MIYNSEALILSSRPYRDTSLICNLFTKESGRLSIISKGARTFKNPNRAILQPLQFIDLHYYYKPKRNIQLLKEASINTHFFNIAKNYQKVTFSYNILELTNQICKIDNPNEIMFRLIKSVLKKIDTCEIEQIHLYYLFFQLQLSRYVGVQPILDNCFLCSQQLYDALYDKSIGQLVCNNCTEHKSSNVIIKQEDLKILKYLSNTHIDNLLDHCRTNQKSLSAISQYLLHYISFHIVNINNLKTIKFIR